MLLLGAIFQPEEDKLWLGGTSRAATLNGEQLVTFLPGRGRRHADGGHAAGRTRRRHLHPPHLAGRSDVRHALARGRDVRGGAAHVRVRLLRPRPGGRRRAGLLVPAQLPRVGLAARQGDRRAPPAARPTSCGSTAWSGSWREARRRCGSCVPRSSPARWTSSRGACPLPSGTALSSRDSPAVPASVRGYPQAGT